MASTLENALKFLGVENADDPALLWQNYMDRLGVLQTELIRAASESRQQELQAQLAKLVASYQLLRSAAQLKRSYAATMVRPLPPGAMPPASALPRPEVPQPNIGSAGTHTIIRSPARPSSAAPAANRLAARAPSAGPVPAGLVPAARPLAMRPAPQRPPTTETPAAQRAQLNRIPVRQDDEQTRAESVRPSSAADQGDEPVLLEMAPVLIDAATPDFATGAPLDLVGTVDDAMAPLISVAPSKGLLLLVRTAHCIGLTNLSDEQINNFETRNVASVPAPSRGFIRLTHALGLTNLSNTQVREYCARRHSANTALRATPPRTATAPSSPMIRDMMPVRSAVAENPSLQQDAALSPARPAPAVPQRRPMPIPQIAAANHRPAPAPEPIRVERVDGNSVTPVRSESDPAANIMPPSVIRPGALLQGRYEIETLLGDGGMGRVYAARDRLKDEDVAIKVLRNELLSSMAARGRFLSEAKVSCRLAHPNIVRVFDVGVADGRYFFTMERLNGKSLRQRMQQHQKEKTPFPLDAATAIAHQLLDALRHAHRYIVHRDLKPENVWIEDNGVVKLMDFGISRAYVQTEVTRTGISMGTAYYMAPEQLMNANNVDWRADQYAFGVLMYELLTGRVPIGVIQSLERVRKDVPKGYARAIMRTLSHRPEERFQSLRELQNVLISYKPVDLVDAVFNATFQALVLGSIAGGAFWLIDSFARPRAAELALPSSIAVGIGTVLTFEIVEMILRSKALTNMIAAAMTSVAWISAVLFLSQRVSGFSDGLVMMLCSSIAAGAAELVTRRWGSSATRRYRLQAAFTGAFLGSLLGSILVLQGAASGRSYWLSALGGLVSGLVISISALRRSRISPDEGRKTLPERAHTTNANSNWQDHVP